MARTVSVFDDSTCITAAMTVDDSGSVPRITELRFIATDDATITAEDLRLVSFFGLTLPAADAPAIAPAMNGAERDAIVGKLPVQKTVPARKSPPRKTLAQASPLSKKERFSGKRPDDTALLKLWHECNGNHAAMAKKVGCHSTTVGMWIKEAKARLIEFPVTS